MRQGGQRREHTARAGRGGLCEASAPGVVVAEAARAEPHAVETIEVAAHEDAQPGTGAAARLLVDLQLDALEGHRVVLPDGAGLFVAEDVGEVDASEGHKRGSRIGGRVGKAGVVGGQKACCLLYTSPSPRDRG